MNGEVNGAMEEPTSTFHPKLIEDIQNKNTVLEYFDSATNNTENTIKIKDINQLDGEISAQHVEYTGNENGNSRDSDSHKSLNQNFEGEETCHLQDNHCSNSNESYQSSSIVTSQKTLDQHQNLKIIDEVKDIVSAKDKITNDEKIEHEGNSEDSSSEDVSGDELKAEDTVSINSDSELDDDDTSQESQSKNHSNEIIILENEKTDSQCPEVHEIDSDNDDCVVTNDNDICAMTNDNNSSCNKSEDSQLRRSNRTIKRKIYADASENGDESDIEEIEMLDPLSGKIKPIVINDTKTLVEMAAKRLKSNHNHQQSEPTVVIIDTNANKSGKQMFNSNIANKNSGLSTVGAQNLYQSIVARGTTVTPVSKASSTTQTTTNLPQPAILPSLTDDMFVVEAPSFIVPYVYEKPSLKPFREFVDVLGKELENQKAKEDKDLLEKTKEIKEKQENESMEVNDEEIKKEDETENEKRKKKISYKSEKHSRKNDDDDASWDGESSTDSEDEVHSDEDKTVVIKDKMDSFEEIKHVTDLSMDKVCSTKSDNYFDCSLGKFFINIGLSFVQEYVQNDLLKQQNRKLYREKKTGQNTKATETSIASLKKNLEFSKENNAPFSTPQNKCEFCSFKTESKLVMEHHLETPHMKNGVYRCNHCEFEIRSPHDILYHMETKHNVRGKLERAPAYHQCANCPFEDNGKGKLARHLVSCAKKYKPSLNLAPPIEWEPPAKIPKISRARNYMMGSYNSMNRQMGSNVSRPVGLMNMAGASGSYRPRSRAPSNVAQRGSALPAPLVRPTGLTIRHSSPLLMSTSYTPNNGKSKPGHQPSISITPLPRHPQPVPVQNPQTQNKSTFVICEICDGYIKDLEQLRNHMQWIHKVKIHPKMIYNRPPLNCQKCQFRFFTDQGLERHLLGSHGLVTSSMQEAANKGKDAGRCPVCGRVYQWKLLNHVARDHNLTLKPAHLSYKCTVCTATFGMYKQFENHVYSAHSVVAKRVMDKNKTTTPPKPTNKSLLKPLKINDEITIIPQPVKSSTTASTKDK